MEKWVLKNKKADFDAIMEQHKVSEVLARLLVNRNHVMKEDIASYLHPDLSYLHDPGNMKDADKACQILMEKIRSGKKIRIVGDYDVMELFLPMCSILPFQNAVLLWIMRYLTGLRMDTVLI
jgi:single-stranded-DNA-specific exonuclease